MHTSSSQAAILLVSFGTLGKKKQAVSFIFEWYEQL